MNRLNRSDKRRAQRWRANSRAVMIGAGILAVGFLAGTVVGFFARPAKAAYTPPLKAEKAVVYTVRPDTASVRYALTDAERDLVERVVMAEAGGEGYDGQRLVAQCILNTAEAMDLRPDEVVLAPNQYAAPAREVSQEVKDAVGAVFDDGDMVTEEPIQWFYAPRYVSSAWHESKVFVLEHGGHRFFKEG